MLRKTDVVRPCNPEALLDAVDRDFATFQEMVELFHVSSASQVGEVATAIVAGDIERVERAAEAMRTSLAVVGAMPALEVVHAIVQDPRGAARETGPGVVAALMAAVLAADGELRRFCNDRDHALARPRSRGRMH